MDRSSTFTSSILSGTSSSAIGLATGSIRSVSGYVFDLGEVAGPPVCAFPVSGSWSFLPRIVFYISIVFALVAHTHEWLIGGALAAALVYSSLAALQVIAQVVSHRAMAELDLIAISGILASSCIIAVPLMNWSKKIQRLGLPHKDLQFERHIAQYSQHQSGDPLEPISTQQTLTNKPSRFKKKNYGPTRIILVFWSILVAVGFLSVFVGIQSYFAGASWINIGIALDNITNPSGISCLPSNGVLDITAGQLPGWSTLRMSRQFLQQNNCNDPCAAANNVNTLFRSTDELFVLSANSIDYWVVDRIQNKVDRLKVQFAEYYFKVMLNFLPFILLQGAMHIAFFWRSSPQRARWRIYLLISGVRPEDSRKYIKVTSLRTRLAFITAISLYLFALLVLILAPIAFAVNVFATELTLHFIRESETPDHVDQWGAFAAMILVVIAAIICRLDPSRRIVWEEAKLRAKLEFREHQLRHERRICQDLGCKPTPKIVYNKPKGQVGRLWSYMTAAAREDPNDFYNSSMYHVKDIWRVVHYEWFMFVQFWNDPQAKPRRREKMDERFYLEMPESHWHERHAMQEEKILELKEDLKRAKSELTECESARRAGHDHHKAVSATTAAVSNVSGSSLPVVRGKPQMTASAQLVPEPSRSISVSSDTILPTTGTELQPLQPSSTTRATTRSDILDTRQASQVDGTSRSDDLYHVQLPSDDTDAHGSELEELLTRRFGSE